MDSADDLSVRLVNHGSEEDIECVCSNGKRYVEGEWLYHGWEFAAGQCCDCMNIWVHVNGVKPAYSIHICDLEDFIVMLQAIKEARDNKVAHGPPA